MSNQEPILATKLFIPPTRLDLVPRPQLINKMNAGLRGKLTLVSAPAGYGKTTLVSAWAQQSGKPVVWLSLDENDNDLVRFLTYLIAGMQQMNGEIGVDILYTLETSQIPQAEILITMLVNQIASIRDEFILVLDDCHRIDNQSIFGALEFLVNHLPPGMHLTLIGRVDPPIQLARLRVGRQLVEIRSDDLRFTHAEAATFLNDLMGLNLLPEDIAALEARTEGWVAGLQLAALSLQGREDKHQFVTAFSGSHQYIIDYLVEEVLARQPAEIRAFLCQTSILDRLNASLCDVTLQISNSQQIIQELNRVDLFLIPLDSERHWYRYHHLFGDFLALCLEEEQSEVIPRLHLRAASWFEQNGFIPEALRHLLAAEDFVQAARLVENSARRMLERSELATLMKWVDYLPADHVCIRPWLCVYHAWALRLSGSRFEVVETRIRDVEEMLEKAGWFASQDEPVKGSEISADEARSLMGHIIALRAFQALYTDRIPQVIKLAQQAQTYQPKENFLRACIGFAIGWANRFSGDLQASSQAFDEAAAVSVASGNIYLAVAALCRSGYGQVMGGKLHQAMESFQEAVQIATRHDGRCLPVAGYAYVYMGGVYLEWNDLENAMRYSTEGTELCERVGYIMDQAVGYAYLAKAKLAEGDLDGAQDACQTAKQLSQRMNDYVYVRRWVEDCQLRLWLAQGNLDAAARWVQESGLSVDDELNFLRDIEHIILARALVALGREQPKSSNVEAALMLLARLRAMVEDAGWMGKAIEILVLQALAFQINGNQEQALTTLERALALAEPEGYVRTFVDEGEPMAELLRQAASRASAPDYIDKLLTGFTPQMALEQHPALDSYIESLSKRELTVLKLLATDLSGPEIAKELCVALSTVRYHTNNIYSKLSVHNRREAVRRAEELNLL